MCSFGNLHVAKSMSKTLLTIDTHSGIENFLPEMWPHYERAGVDILGVERTNKPTVWPKPIPTIAIGEDLFKRWCEHRHPTLLNARTLDTIEALLTMPQFTDYTDFCTSTWSVVFNRPLPPIPAPLVLHVAGGNINGFTSPNFFHHARWFDRETAATILKTGRALMAEGRNELGSEDFFFGLIIQTAGLKWHNIRTVTMNSMDSPERLKAARKAIANGALWVGNVKDSGQLASLTAP